MKGGQQVILSGQNFMENLFSYQSGNSDGY